MARKVEECNVSEGISIGVNTKVRAYMLML